MLTPKQFLTYLRNKSNADLLETIKNKSFYSRPQISVVTAEIKRRKAKGLMRKNAGIKRK
jgi:hypothetical protein